MAGVTLEEQLQQAHAEIFRQVRERAHYHRSRARDIEDHNTADVLEAVATLFEPADKPQEKDDGTINP